MKKELVFNKHLIGSFNNLILQIFNLNTDSLDLERNPRVEENGRHSNN
jgi:hypothetical protein